MLRTTRGVESRSQKTPGTAGFVKPVMLESGAAKVMMPEMLVAMILGMGSGSALTPKGGLQELIAAYDRGELSTAATKEMWSGKFGEGAYKDEPWSIVALRKRVYAMRKFYELELTGTSVVTRESKLGQTWGEESMPPVVPVSVQPRRRPVLRQGSSMSSIDTGEATAAAPVKATRHPPTLQQESSSASCIDANDADAALEEVEPLLTETSGRTGMNVLQRRWRAARRREHDHARANSGSRPPRRMDGSEEQGPWWDGLVSICACCIIVGLALAWIFGFLGALFYGLSKSRAAAPPHDCSPLRSVVCDGGFCRALDAHAHADALFRVPTRVRGLAVCGTVYWNNVTTAQVIDEFHHTRAKNLAYRAAEAATAEWPRSVP